MSAITLSIIAIILYTTATTLQIAVYQGKIPQRSKLALLMGILAVAAHGAGLWQQFIDPAGINFGIFTAQTLICLIISLIVTLFAIVKPVHNSKLIIFPVTILSIILALNTEHGHRFVDKSATGLLIHAAFSIVAYAVFLLASVQAGLLFAQNKQLKHHLTGRLVKALPPLQTTEAILFEMIWAGLIMLTLAIVSGGFFVDDLFAQKIAHKTIFTLLSWVLFAVLLVARKFWGWRGLRAAKITIFGFLLLMLGYLGSNIVIEFVLTDGSAGVVTG